MKNFGYLKLSLATAFLLMAVGSTSVWAASLLSQSYQTDVKIPLGSIVSLKKGFTDKVEPATTTNIQYLLGVVVDDNNSELSISSNKVNQVLVSATGVQSILVSDINGKIAIGDPITASPISGVGMKATGNSKIIGQSQDVFPNSTASKTNYKDKNGKQQNVNIGQVPVQVNVAYYYRQPEKSLIPPAIQNIADALAGKKVDPLPILISIAIFIISMFIVTSVVYSLIHSSIISVGRNPMSQSAVYRNVMQLSALVVVILAIAVASIYMVLTKF